jgi:hypothetical protein
MSDSHIRQNGRPHSLPGLPGPEDELNSDSRACILTAIRSRPPPISFVCRNDWKSVSAAAKTDNQTLHERILSSVTPVIFNAVVRV